MQSGIWWSLDRGKQSLNPTSHCNTSINEEEWVGGEVQITEINQNLIPPPLPYQP